MKKVSRILITCLLLLLAVFLISKPVRQIYNRMRMEQAVSIYACYPAFGMNIEEYEINLEEQRLYEYQCYINEYVPRDTTSKNRGWQSMEPLSDEQTAALRRAGAAILNWKRRYDNPYVMDGVQWRIIITFQDGSTCQTSGSNDWPLDYSVVQKEFQANGANIILYDP